MKGRLTIVRDSDDRIRIEFVDAESRVRFASMHMSLDGFAQALTGMAGIEGDLQVMGLEKVGKRLIVEYHSIDCPLTTYDRSELRKWLLENAHHPGGEVDASLSSHSSIGSLESGRRLNYIVRRYEPIGEE